ncbi:hypothetical protein ATL51_5196 [Pseudonocardia alni]|uniref:Uncharacterized protein n=1 Tax=Pseudonocardia alni TaxID=33907 RepID=A0AA44UTW5_PSEA5|nr:hypothetical protein [Pseudonocardia alni]PKB33434.1 hypothetical protein ATL51_5196 [Pseudonocardia alni]
MEPAQRAGDGGPRGAGRVELVDGVLPDQRDDARGAVTHRPRRGGTGQCEGAPRPHPGQCPEQGGLAAAGRPGDHGQPAGPHGNDHVRGGPGDGRGDVPRVEDRYRGGRRPCSCPGRRRTGRGRRRRGGAHPHDPVGDRGDGRVVGDDEGDAAAGPEQLDDDGGRGGIEARGGLVEHEQGGVACQRPGERDPAGLAPGEPVGPQPPDGRRVEADRTERRIGVGDGQLGPGVAQRVQRRVLPRLAATPSVDELRY